LGKISNAILTINKGMKGRQIDLWPGMDKKGHGQPTLIPPGGVGDPVSRTLEHAIGKVLQHIANIHHDLAGGGLNWHPLTIAGENF